MKSWALSTAALAAALSVGAVVQAAEPACGSYTPAVVGGPVPGKNSSIVVLRWLGNADYEVDYQATSSSSTPISTALRAITTSA